MDTKHSTNTPHLWMVVAGFATIYLVWGSTFLGIAFALETLPPFTMAGIRFLSAGLLLYALVRRRAGVRPTFANWRAATLIGCLMLFGGNAMVCWAEQHVASGLASLMLGTIPLWFVTLDWLLHRGPRPTGRVIIGLAAGLFGVATLIGPGTLGGSGIHLGGAFALTFACLSWSFGSLYARRVDLPKSLFLTTAMEMTAAGVVLLLFGASIGEWARIDLAAVSLKSLLSVAYLSVFGSIVALSTYNWLLKVSTPARVATYAYVNPVVAMALGYFFAGESITPRVVLAATAILAAVILITTARTGKQCEPKVCSAGSANGNDRPPYDQHLPESVCEEIAGTQPSVVAPVTDVSTGCSKG